MKIKAFHAKDGDCLLLRGDDDTVILADGGRSSAFEKNVLPALAALDTDIDLIYVSHIDNDHISGILKLVDAKIQWRVFDFHNGESDFTGKPPKLLRPAKFKEIWHNGFTSLVDDQSGRIEDTLVQATQTLALNKTPEVQQVFEMYENLVTGVQETLELNYRLELCGFDDIWNAPSGRPDFLMVLSDNLEKFNVGGMTVSILGPTVDDLELLRKAWNKWLDKNVLDVPAIRREAEDLADDTGQSLENATLNLLLKEATRLGEGRVTEPNVASLTLLVDDGQHTVLLTGDARSQEILAGLRKHGLMDDNNGLHVDVLKVQHHGAAGNVTKEFCEFVTADHYIFCANGASTNPEKVVLDGFLEHRIGNKVADCKTPNAKDPFQFWFTTKSTTKGITTGQKKFLKSVEDHLDANWSGHPDKFKRNYPDPQVSEFSIEIDLA